MGRTVAVKLTDGEATVLDVIKEFLEAEWGSAVRVNDSVAMRWAMIATYNAVVRPTEWGAEAAEEVGDGE